VTANQSSRYQHLAAIEEDTFDAVVEAHKRAGEPISTASVARVADAIEELPSDAREELVARGEAAILEQAKLIRAKKAEERRATVTHNTSEATEPSSRSPVPRATVSRGKAKALGYERPRDIRKLIERLMPHLLKHGLTPQRGASWLSGSGTARHGGALYVRAGTAGRDHRTRTASLGPRKVRAGVGFQRGRNLRPLQRVNPFDSDLPTKLAKMGRIQRGPNLGHLCAFRCVPARTFRMVHAGKGGRRRPPCRWINYQRGRDHRTVTATPPGRPPQRDG
jgi:hypothetical protein